jgi:hypothetical protein
MSKGTLLIEDTRSFAENIDPPLVFLKSRVVYRDAGIGCPLNPTYSAI